MNGDRIHDGYLDAKHIGEEFWENINQALKQCCNLQ